MMMMMMMTMMFSSVRTVRKDSDRNVHLSITKLPAAPRCMGVLGVEKTSRLDVLSQLTLRVCIKPGRMLRIPILSVK